MRIGVPKEIKDQEFRVGLSPASVSALVAQGHPVVVETQAGAGAGFGDELYQQAGAEIAGEAATAWAQDLVVKVKEPLPAEYDFLRQDLLLFTYLHLAAQPDLVKALLAAGTTAIAYEMVELNDGRLPLLHPMSVIAGRLAVQFGSHFLQRQSGGRGVLLGGIPGVKPAQVVILGGGVVGTEAARMAVGLGAQVTIIELNLDRLYALGDLFGFRVQLLHSNSTHIAEMVPQADLLIGAVLLPGRRTPTLVPETLVKQMIPGSVIIDVAVDQGGCVATLRPTTHTEPVYTKYGVLHYGVPNMPGAVPWTATQALNQSIFPYLLDLAERGRDALAPGTPLGRGVNTQGGKLIPAVLQELFSG
ncbi:Alanine dehydrogenase and pyridine nucleotide transhydrogenase [Gloeomargarita lithophora Alchichica-D10]|uniref:Alanine dehydrogenase n=1 Tax=Gloeomargarita lithophora Alchichica-D10 TaxID=1188229 RepID=A0A1J0ABP8_9CYAN|nr:alanine dehydrogenase [Gloeomargarita lithophora]APB33349.1 Alanine dehydrogenase and pyridine nucleotide transhydrogenase [Gloeomargarita lithophora Alchichica-D10]